MSLTKILYKTPLFQTALNLEEELVLRDDVIRYTDISPTRFDIIRGRLESTEGGPPVRLVPTMLACLAGIRESLESLDDNPAQPGTEANQGLHQTAPALGLPG